MSDIEHLDKASATQELGDYAIEFVDRLHGEHESFELGEILIVAEVITDAGTVVDILSSETRPYVAAAILKRALEITEGAEALPVDED
jgi:hypothetical protein